MGKGHIAGAGRGYKGNQHQGKEGKVVGSKGIIESNEKSIQELVEIDRMDC